MAQTIQIADALEVLDGDRRPRITHSVAAMASLATVLLAARLASWRLKKCRWDASGYLLVMALILAWANAALIFRCTLGNSR